MIATKKRYKVKIKHYQYYDGGRVDYSEETLGYTNATSKKQAENNMKYRLGIRNSDLYCDGYDYSRDSFIEAEEC